ncbi:IS110 family transposase [Faecalicoccus pleomorphus]|uniref:IS110 family transposase n=1 Tax=Faecalicoccus pleomorphus TaxID=1323 RepID=UPI0039F5B9F5
MEDTGHYHFNLLKFLLDSSYTVVLINPITTDMTCKMQLGATKDNDLDVQLISDVLASNQCRKGDRISKVNGFEFYEQKRLTREHHDLKEHLNVYTNKLQKCINIVFPEFNSLFRSFIRRFSEHLEAPMRLLMPIYTRSVNVLKSMVEDVRLYRHRKS